MGPTKAYIDHNHLRHNFNLIRDAVKPAMVMGVVKADAYGHGSAECARTLLECGAGYLGVAFPEEGIELRQAGIEAPILVFGAQLSEFFGEHIANNLDITLASAQQIEPLLQICRRMANAPESISKWIPAWDGLVLCLMKFFKLFSEFLIQTI